MKKISIIIPCYNAITYIDECINSVLFFKDSVNIQLIFIDDGSTDDTVDFITNKIRCSNVEYIIHEQENFGVSSARNKGISYANGDYLLFLDSDDIIINLDLALNYAIKNDDDISIFEYVSIENSKDIFSFDMNANCNKVLKNDFIKGYLGYDFVSRVSLCSCVFKRKYIDDISLSFDEKYAFAEDQLFLLKSLVNANSIYYENIKILGYRQHQLSVTKKYNIKRYDAIKVFELLKIDYNEYEHYLDIRINKELLGVGTLFYSVNNISNSIHFYNKMIKTKEKKCLNYNTPSLKYYLFFNFPRVYIFSYAIYRALKCIKIF